MEEGQERSHEIPTLSFPGPSSDFLTSCRGQVNGNGGAEYCVYRSVSVEGKNFQISFRAKA